ncbi:hypothetical protein BT96DRAFT_922766 [Gymnopus androsaceus JB14]|uniref:Uncharacterized protein n=1 Tax=Gymnopus androsaceus JB14 TaxID=1447944 RepID=A0A6A4HD47_9AGAR|nr:hypothetical protein BT96DRAFT_922766 [Gymnopus androsaceus JB14]
MTPSEAKFIAYIGSSIYSETCQWMVACILYGAFLIPAILAIYLFLENGLQGYRRKIIFSVLILVVLVATWNYLPAFAIPLIMVKFDTRAEESVVAENVAINPWLDQISWPSIITLLISDGIVAWRAWVIWPGSKIIQYTLITLMFGNIVLNLAGNIFQNVQMDFVTSNSLSMVAIFISLGVNITATAMIGLKIWYHHRTTRILHWSKKRTFSPAGRILLLLVESGALFCIVQLITAILNILNNYTALLSSLQFAYLILIQFFLGLTSIYPMVIMILISLDQSALDETFQHDNGGTINTPSPTIPT